MLIYYGSDHVVLSPSYLDLSPDGLFHCFLERADGCRQACKNNRIGVLNCYTVDSTADTHSWLINSSEIGFPKEALSILKFESASFVHTQNK